MLTFERLLIINNHNNNKNGSVRINSRSLAVIVIACINRIHRYFFLNKCVYCIYTVPVTWKSIRHFHIHHWILIGEHAAWFSVRFWPVQLNCTSNSHRLSHESSESLTSRDTLLQQIHRLTICPPPSGEFEKTWETLIGGVLFIYFFLNKTQHRPRCKCYWLAMSVDSWRKLFQLSWSVNLVHSTFPSSQTSLVGVVQTLCRRWDSLVPDKTQMSVTHIGLMSV